MGKEGLDDYVFIEMKCELILNGPKIALDYAPS